MIQRLHRAWQRRAATWFGRRLIDINLTAPIVSFTFDDFPASALSTGGSILEKHGQRGTYYTALGLAGKTIETGQMFKSEDVAAILTRGHELGCHTYDHCPAWETHPARFEASVEENRKAVAQLVDGSCMPTLSFPISNPRPGTKRRMAQRFKGCRGGGQTFNRGSTDLNYLRSTFIEQWRNTPARLHALIGVNAQNCGWLIFSTHDISENPTRYGCSPQLFSDLVERSLASGAKILPVAEALDAIHAGRAA